MGQRSLWMGEQKNCSSIDIYPETAYCLFKNKARVQTGGKVACSSILKASFTDYTLRLLTYKRSHSGWIFFFFFLMLLPFTFHWAELLYNLFAWPWEAVRLKTGKRKTEGFQFSVHSLLTEDLLKFLLVN